MPTATPGWIAALATAILISMLILLTRPPSQSLSLHTGVALTPPLAVPAFNLIDHSGNPFTEEALVGQWNLVFAGFTHCPDICPTTLNTFNRVYEILGDNAQGLQVILLTVDPERDTSEALARYLDFFNPAFRGVTGDQEQLELLYGSLGVKHIRIPGAKGEYSVDHSASLLLVNPEGHLAGYFMPPFNAELLAVDLDPLVATRAARSSGLL
ncbi:SCO family protein [Kineobactrum sediminis]|uniref:SCO family protein n=1 Tax=Kineobactrum sediminis TaxID=1905677 RepID=A0A2N5Y510_9GAMM|nr:SCO family protein [Kineobactrum sediminis]PLW83485.1 SCO family protein [Kineobactrum sediminis]